MSNETVRDHAEVGDSVWWPDERWLWSVSAIIETTEGPRLLAIFRGDTEEDIATRVIPETAVLSNAFRLPA